MAESRVTMDLWINTQSNTVIYAEAGKDCVDFLFSILSLPIAAAIRLMSKQEMPGSVANLYESFENLNEEYMQPQQDKNILLKPMSMAHEHASVPLLHLNDALTEMNLYTCAMLHLTCYVSEDTHAVCPECGQNIDTKTTYVAPPTPVGQKCTKFGFVNGLAKYMVMDNLVVKPVSAISDMRLLSQIGVKDVNALVEKQVNLGSAQAVKLLKTSLHSKNVLTEVFLRQG